MSIVRGHAIKPLHFDILEGKQNLKTLLSLYIIHPDRTRFICGMQRTQNHCCAGISVYTVDTQRGNA